MDTAPIVAIVDSVNERIEYLRLLAAGWSGTGNDSARDDVVENVEAEHQ